MAWQSAAIVAVAFSVAGNTHEGHCMHARSVTTTSACCNISSYHATLGDADRALLHASFQTADSVTSCACATKNQGEENTGSKRHDTWVASCLSSKQQRTSCSDHRGMGSSSPSSMPSRPSGVSVSFTKHITCNHPHFLSADTAMYL